MLGDNIFYGPGLGYQLATYEQKDGATVLAYRVADPRAYGVVEFDEDFSPLSIGGEAREPQERLRDSGSVLLPIRRSWSTPDRLSLRPAVSWKSLTLTASTWNRVN